MGVVMRLHYLLFLYLILGGFTFGIRGQIQSLGQNYLSVKAYDLDTNLVTPNSLPEAQQLYRYFRSVYGNKILSSVMTLGSFDEINWLKNNTGKEPAIIGLDFMHCYRGYTWYDNEHPIKDAISYWSRNGIAIFCWHWRDPSRRTETFYTRGTHFDVSKIFDVTSAEYKAMIRDIDSIASLLKILQYKGIPVLWRPLHEASGKWFWWGAKGPEPYKELYRVMFHRMVNTHGLRNLIWVWTTESDDEEWYPGDAYVDIIGRDLYKKGNHQSHIKEFNKINASHRGKKMIALSECGSIPSPDNLIKDKASWLWFMPWYGNFVRNASYNSLEFWKEVLHNEYVITLDKMPSFK
jgi:Beta-mannanase